MYRIFGNMVWFLYNFFSIPILLRTLFAPFKRLDEGYKKGLDLGAFFETLIVNMLMRLVGAALRLFLIMIGLVAVAVACIFYLFIFLVWLLAPLLLAGLLISAATFIVL